MIIPLAISPKVWLWIFSLLAALGCVLGLQAGLVRTMAAGLLTLAPGVLLAWRATDSSALRLVLAVPLGLGASTLLSMALVLCGQAGFAGLMAPAVYPALLAALGVALAFYGPRASCPKLPGLPDQPRWWYAGVAAVALAAGWFRFAHLGYSDFQGDEAHNCLSLALDLLNNANGALAEARRPPLQALWCVMSQRLAGTLDEGVVRLPFALAGTWAALNAAVCGTVLFGRRNARQGAVAGLLAGGLWAVDGLQIAFGRIVQYQPAVCLFLASSAVCLALALRTRERPDGWRVRQNPATALVLGFVLFGVGTCAHYEALLFAPLPLLTLRWLGWPRGSRAALAAFALTATLAYLPMLLGQAFGGHMEYYGAKRFDSPVNIGIGWILGLGTVYTSWGFLLLLAMGAVAYCVSKPPRDEKNFLLAWFVPYFVFYFVVMTYPKTHIYTYYLPWSMAAAAGLTRLPGLLAHSRRLPARLRFTAKPVVTALLVLALGGWTVFHLQTRFVSHLPEYPWTAERPARSLFGFPYQRGWDAAGYLYRTGELRGPYAGNEKDRISAYYLRQEPVDSGQAELYLHVRDPQSWDAGSPPAGFGKVVRIEVGGRPVMDVYAKGAAGAARTVDAGDYDLLYPALDKGL